MFDQIFADFAVGFSDAFGGPFSAAEAVWDGTPVRDLGGRIVTPGTPVRKSCQVQFDAATQAMRQAEGFLETDARALVLTATLDGILDTSARIVADGATWELITCTRDPAGIGYECRARRI